MARQRERDTRFDWRRGVNTAYSPDVLDKSELRSAVNALLSVSGAVEKRAGSQRIHDTTLETGSRIMGLWQWDAPGGKQVVAVANGKFHHKLPGASDFTSVTPSTAMSTSVPASFRQFRDGATVVLYIASGGTLYRWDGTTLSEPSGQPSAHRLETYKGRLVATQDTKEIQGSAIRDGTDWSAGGGAFIAQVETYDQEPVVGILTVGSSLLLAKDDNLARWTGVAAEDVRLDTETEGVSSEVGLEAPATFVLFDEVAFLLTQKGPYIANESSVQFVGDRIQDQFLEEWDKSAWDDAVAAYHKDRSELYLFGPESSENDVCWVYDTDLQAWAGPCSFPFNVSAACRYERSDGSETVLVGGYDGFVRELDVLTSGEALDDVLRDGTGGTEVAVEVELPMIHFGAPHIVKGLGRRLVQKIEADLGTEGKGLLEVELESEWGKVTREIPSSGSGVKDYPFVLGGRGKRLKLTLREETGQPVSIHGLLLQAAMGRQHV